MSREVVELTLNRYTPLFSSDIIGEYVCFDVFLIRPCSRQPGSSQSWGLRLVGGADVGTLLKVEKVKLLHISQRFLYFLPSRLLTVSDRNVNRWYILLMAHHQSPSRIVSVTLNTECWLLSDR